MSDPRGGDPGDPGGGCRAVACTLGVVALLGTRRGGRTGDSRSSRPSVSSGICVRPWRVLALHRSRSPGQPVRIGIRPALERLRGAPARTKRCRSDSGSTSPLVAVAAVAPLASFLATVRRPLTGTRAGRSARIRCSSPRRLAIGLVGGAVLALRVVPRSRRSVRRLLVRAGDSSDRSWAATRSSPLRYHGLPLSPMLAAALGTLAAATPRPGAGRSGSGDLPGRGNVRVEAADYSKLPTWPQVCSDDRSRRPRTSRCDLPVRPRPNGSRRPLVGLRPSTVGTSSTRRSRRRVRPRRPTSSRPSHTVRPKIDASLRAGRSGLR